MTSEVNGDVIEELTTASTRTGFSVGAPQLVGYAGRYVQGKPQLKGQIDSMSINVNGAG